MVFRAIALKAELCLLKFTILNLHQGNQNSLCSLRRCKRKSMDSKFTFILRICQAPFRVQNVLFHLIPIKTHEVLFSLFTNKKIEIQLSQQNYQFPQPRCNLGRDKTTIQTQFYIFGYKFQTLSTIPRPILICWGPHRR